MLPIALRRHIRLTPVAAAVALGALWLPGTALAAGPRVTVSPQQQQNGSYRSVSFFDQSINRGRSLQARIVVKNLGSTAARVALDPVDALTAENLGSAYKPRGLRTNGPTRWMRISRRVTVVLPGQEVPLQVRVNVPRRAKPGDYLSGVSVQVLNQRPTKSRNGGAQVNSEQRYAIGAVVRVPGKRHPRIRFHGASVGYEPGGVTFRLKARNEGNAILQNVQGSATITRAGSRVLVARMGPGTFVTGTSIRYPLIAARQHPQSGTAYRVRAVLRYRGGIARLDQVVRFGDRAAKTQEEFGGPKAKRDSGGLPAWVWLVAALVALGGLARWLQKRAAGRGASGRPLAPDAALARLERELAGVREHGQPVSVVVLPDTPQDAETRDRVMHTLEPRLRPADVVGSRNGKGLMIILPDTSERAAAGQVEDMSRVLSSVEGLPAGSRIGTATASEPIASDQLLERAARDATG